MIRAGSVLLVVCCSVAVFVVASCTASTKCDAETCGGCCLEGECYGGQAKLACGLKGAQCTKCGIADQCLKGECELDPTLDPVTGKPICACTNGCCGEDGGCLAGTVAEACGVARRLCVKCAADERCARGTCSNEKCDAGCIDPGTGECKAGTAMTACGTGGAICVSCQAGTACMSSTCVSTTCDATTCPAGCCNSNFTCVSPPNNQDCGYQGGACQACGPGTTCSQGVCQ